jgi:tetraacyldisaccharide 4'-kinase
MEGDFIRINKWLLPLSWLYGLGVRFRNLLFEMDVLKSHTFSVPVISVGNITVGGTGKTPHVEYLVKLLQDLGKVAVLSRGYKRKTSGFIIADKDSTASTIGDEPMQMKQNYPKAIVAVDKNRVRGIKRLVDYDPEIDAILLDDAFQHRYVTPGINILLVDYHRLIIYDKLLPAGRLREPLKGKNRADIVIVTKCPKELKPMEYRVITKAMDLYPYQNLFFTTFDYSQPTPVFANENAKAAARPTLETLSQFNILLLTGIASPQQLENDLEQLAKQNSPDQGINIKSLSFPDHHTFRKKDVRLINQDFEALPKPRCIITTEKDAARLQSVEGLSDEVRASIYALPIHVSFMLDQESTFNENIIGYVRKNSRNSILAKRKDDNKPKDSHRAGNGPRTISFRNH